MQKLAATALKQYRFKGVGFVRTMMAYLMFYLAPINFLLLVWTAWHTTISLWAYDHAPWLNIWIFLLIISVVLLLGLILEFKLVLPSMVAFQNTQAYQHSNPIAADFRTVMAKLEKIEKLLEEQDEKKPKN